MKERLMMYLHRRMIACDEASYLVSLRHDHRLRPLQWWQLKIHMMTCHLCRKYARQVGHLHAAVETYRKSACNGHCIHHLPKEKAGRMQILLAGGGDANANEMLKGQ